MTMTANIGDGQNEGKRASHDPTAEKASQRGAATLGVHAVHAVHVSRCCHVTKPGYALPVTYPCLTRSRELAEMRTPLAGCLLAVLRVGVVRVEAQCWTGALLVPRC